MSDRMYPIPFPRLLDWIEAELRENGSVFGCSRFYRATPGEGVSFFGDRLETPLGPAAGPHTQLAQNIVSAYVCGGRFFELKTVQQLDGEDLKITKPCILAEDEGYNCEWSTELTVPQAFEEYVKAWFLLHLLAKELEMGSAGGFAFNMSVGYDLAGIRSEKVDAFIEGMKDASGTDAFRRCRQQLLDFLPRCRRMTAADVEAISPRIGTSVALSTMHGCPAGEIERIARYLIEEKGLSLLLKCNPTLLGYDQARSALDSAGFGHVRLIRDQFENDLQYGAAVSLIRSLQEAARQKGVFFGVKLTNTLPVENPGGDMADATLYMSGRSLLPLSLGVAAKLAADLGGSLPLSYCGGADAKNAAALLSAGLSPVTVCTDLLKPGGYHRLTAAAESWRSAAQTVPAEADASRIARLSADLCASAGKAAAIRRRPVPQEPDCRVVCRVVCGSCVSACPNRANQIVSGEGRRFLLHLDGLCNHCGNCASFCPEKCAPYLEKLTLFPDADALRACSLPGFAPAEDGCFLVRQQGMLSRFDPDAPSDGGESETAQAIRAVLRFAPHLLRLYTAEKA